MSTFLILFAALLVLAPAALYAVWRIRYRYPPGGLPQALCYHKISNRFCFEGTWTTPARFLSQIDFLSERGYRFIGESEFLDGLERPSAGGEKELLLTFDDGYEDVCRLAGPGLLERKIPFHIFLVTDYCGRDNTWDLSLGRRPSRHLSWTTIEEMAGNGVTFGSHGATHRDLIRLSNEERMEELFRSKKEIERKLGRTARTFSYPFGRYDVQLKTLVREAGYEAAFSLYPSHGNDRTDRFALRRNGVYIIDTNRSLLHKLERGGFSWFEEMKCRSINGVAALTPLFKSFSRDRGR